MTYVLRRTVGVDGMRVPGRRRISNVTVCMDLLLCLSAHHICDTTCSITSTNGEKSELINENKASTRSTAHRSALYWYNQMTGQCNKVILAYPEVYGTCNESSVKANVD